MNKKLINLALLTLGILLIILSGVAIVVQGAVPLYTTTTCAATMSISSTCGGYSKTCSFGTAGLITNESTTTYSGGCNIVGTELNDFYGQPCSCSTCGQAVSCTATNTFFGFNDTLAPQVFGLIPAAGTAFVVPQTIQIGATVTDDLAIGRVLANITLPDGTVQQIVLSNTTANMSNSFFNGSFTIPALFGVYTVRFIANDTSNNVNSTETTTFLLISDVTPPVIAFVAPSEANNAFINRGNIIINVSATDLNLANITSRLFNSAGTLINNLVTITSPNFVNVTGLADGVYTFNATAIDLASNTASTATRTVTIDRVSPTLLTFSPTNGSTVTTSPAVLSAALNEAGTCIYSLNGGATNVTMTANATATGFTDSPVLADGNYVMNLFCADLAGNTASMQVISFTVNVPSGGSGGNNNNNNNNDEEDDDIFVIPSFDAYASTAVSGTGLSGLFGDSGSINLKGKIKSAFGEGFSGFFLLIVILLIIGILALIFLIAGLLGKGNKKKVDKKAPVTPAVGKKSKK